ALEAALGLRRGLERIAPHRRIRRGRHPDEEFVPLVDQLDRRARWRLATRGQAAIGELVPGYAVVSIRRISGEQGQIDLGREAEREWRARRRDPPGAPQLRLRRGPASVRMEREDLLN